MNEGVVSKETVVLRRWGSSIQKFGFINGVDSVNWPPYRDSKSAPVTQVVERRAVMREVVSSAHTQGLKITEESHTI